MCFPAKRIPLALLILAVGLGAVGAIAAAKRNGPVARSAHAVARDRRLAGAYRFEKNGWIYVHLQGSPADIGFQHGYLLAPEIADAFQAIRLENTHDAHHDWAFFRQAAREMLWPKIDTEYQAELRGIVEGLRARGVSLDLDDVVALNAFLELPGYYAPWYDARHKAAAHPSTKPPLRCSAFVADGSYTKNHDIVMGHNNWAPDLEGERWRIIFDIVPERGYHILMDGFPGVITSDDDFGINSDGIMITETTIALFHGWNPDGIPEFERSRKALQYATSISDYVKILNQGNNGGYANDWLIGDRKTGEIARFEEGLKYTQLWTTQDGYFVGSNFPSDPRVTRYETTFNDRDRANSENARHTRWDELMKQYRGRIDARLGEAFESDVYDAYAKKDGTNERTLCGRVDMSPRGIADWDWGPYYPGGTVQAKITDSEMTARLSFLAHLGPPCGADFYVRPFLGRHRQYDWMAPVLRDMLLYPWTAFSAGETAKR